LCDGGKRQTKQLSLKIDFEQSKGNYANLIYLFKNKVQSKFDFFFIKKNTK
jgi:hypothetical protein